MDRRQFLLSTSMAAAGTMLPLQQLFARKFGEFTPIRRNVGYFTASGGTIGWLASGDGFVVVDSQYPESAGECLDGLKKRTSSSLHALINTHHHGDHTAGNTVFEPAARQIVAHQNVPGLMKKAFQESEDAETEPAYPGTTFEKTWQLQAGDEIVHAKHYGPAHTGGDAVIYFEKANVVHMGDLVFNRMNPYTDRPSGASIHNWVSVLAMVEGEYPADAFYIFGHGTPKHGVTGSREDVAVMRRYLSALVNHVHEGREAGRPKEEIINLKSMPDFPEFEYFDWWTLKNNLEVVYQEAAEN